jgi:hypothetical protein
MYKLAEATCLKAEQLIKKCGVSVSPWLSTGSLLARHVVVPLRHDEVRQASTGVLRFHGRFDLLRCSRRIVGRVFASLEISQAIELSGDAS